MDKGILGAKTIKQASRLMKANVFTCPELIEQTYENIGARSHLNAYVNVRRKEEALKEAEESQKRIEKSKSELKLNRASHIAPFVSCKSSFSAHLNSQTLHFSVRHSQVETRWYPDRNQG